MELLKICLKGEARADVGAMMSSDKDIFGKNVLSIYNELILCLCYNLFTICGFALHYRICVIYRNDERFETKKNNNFDTDNNDLLSHYNNQC